MLTASSEAETQPAQSHVRERLRFGGGTGPAAAVFGLATAASAVFLLTQARKLWFFGDDWDFIFWRGLTGSPRESVWQPHNEHWSTLPILAYRALYTVFGVRHYLPYAALVILLHVAVTVLLWSLLRLAGVRPWIAAAFGSTIALMAAGTENTLWDFQIGFVGSVLFGLMALRLQSRGSRLTARDAGVCLAVIASLMCSGQGLTMLFVVTLYALLARGIRAAIAPAAAGLSAYGIWFLAVGHQGMGAPLDSPLQVPTYVWTGLGHVWEAMTGLPGIGVVTLVVAAGWLLGSGQRLDRRADALAVAGLAGSVCLFSLVALTRAHFGLGMATTGRYAYIAAVLTTPALALACQGMLKDRVLSRPSAWTLTAVFLALVGLNGVNTIVQWREWRVGLVGADVQSVVGAWQIVKANSSARFLRVLPGSHYDTQLDMRGVSEAGRAGKLPNLGANRAGVLLAAERLQVAVSPNGLGLPAPGQFGAHGVRLSGTTLANGCVQGTSTAANALVSFSVAVTGVAVVVRSDDQQLGTQLMDRGVTSPVETWPVTPSTPYSVGSTAVGMTLRIVFPHPTHFSLCM